MIILCRRIKQLGKQGTYWCMCWGVDCNFKLVRESLTEKVTWKQKPRSEGAGYLGVRAKSLPERGTQVQIPRWDKRVPEMFAGWQGRRVVAGSMWVSVQERLGCLLRSLLSTGCRALYVTLRSVASALCHVKPFGGFEHKEWHDHSGCYIGN